MHSGLNGYSDSDWGGVLNDRKLTSGYILQLNESTVDWHTGKQRNVATSTSSTEAEYYALADYCKSKAWIKGFINELKVDGYELGETVTHKDNQGVIVILKNPVIQKRLKQNLHWSFAVECPKALSFFAKVVLIIQISFKLLYFEKVVQLSH
jgi:hypothetical protein